MINDRDARAAWSFTAYCNDVAGKFLLPASEVRQLAPVLKLSLAAIAEQIAKFAQTYRVSRPMVAYQLYRAGMTRKTTWAALDQRFKEEYLQSRQRESEKNKNTEGGPNYYIVRRRRVGHALLPLVRRALDEGTVTYTKASRVLGVKPCSVEPLLSIRSARWKCSGREPCCISSMRTFSSRPATCITLGTRSLSSISLYSLSVRYTRKCPVWGPASALLPRRARVQVPWTTATPIQSIREMGAYEALWSEAKASFKWMADNSANIPAPSPRTSYPTQRPLNSPGRPSKLWPRLVSNIIGIRVHGASECPMKLRVADQPVELLYFQGWWDLIESRAIAVVGTRTPSAQSVARTRRLVRSLVDDNFTVVSGLAKGIDTVPHLTATAPQ